MKKTLSLLLTVVMLLSAFTAATVTASASSVVEYGKMYSHNYTKNNKNCEGTLVVPSDGMVTVTTTLSNGTSVDFSLHDGTKIIVDEYYPEKVFYLFLKKGTYTFNFICSFPDDSDQITYKFTHKSTYNDKVNAIKWNTKYTNYYNTKDCYGSFKLTNPSIVTFNLTQPLDPKGQAYSSYLYIYDEKQNGKEIKYEFFASNGDYNNKYSIKLDKGSYKFNYYTGGVYGDKYYVDNLYTSTYKLSYTKAKTPKTPKLNVTTNNSYYKYSKIYYCSASVEMVDDKDYDGVQLWTKSNSGKWKLKEDKKNSSLIRYVKFHLNGSFKKSNNLYYKVRTYSLYGNTKKYSSYSDVCALNTNIAPKKPSIKTSSPNKKTAKITWKKVSGAKGYQIYRSTKKSGGYSKIKTTTATSLTSKGLKSKKTYYFKVRAYTKKHGETIYGSFSSVKSVKIK